MAGKYTTVVIEEGRPGVDEARAALNAAIASARSGGVAALKIVHGYGSSGRGGTLRSAVRNSLRKRRKEGLVRCIVPGEKWSVFDEDARRLLEACPELAKDPDLNRYNEGITLVLL